MIKRKTQIFLHKKMLTYCLESFYIVDFYRFSLCQYIVFLVYDQQICMKQFSKGKKSEQKKFKKIYYQFGNEICNDFFLVRC